MLEISFTYLPGMCESARALVLNVGMELTQRQVIGIILWDVTNCSFNKRLVFLSWSNVNFNCNFD